MWWQVMNPSELATFVQAVGDTAADTAAPFSANEDEDEDAEEVEEILFEVDGATQQELRRLLIEIDAEMSGYVYADELAVAMGGLGLPALTDWSRLEACEMEDGRLDYLSYVASIGGGAR